jgi:hypothetical protein
MALYQKFNQVVAAKSSTFAYGGAANDKAQLMSGNSITLTPGKWRLQGIMQMAGSSSSNVRYISAAWFTNNGDNSTALNALGGKITPVEGTNDLQQSEVTDAASLGWQVASVLPPITYTVTSNTSVFLVGSANYSAAGGGGTIAYLYAERIG